MARKTGAGAQSPNDYVRAVGDVVQHLQHLPLTSESDAELVNNPLQYGLSMPGKVAWRIFAKAAGAALEGRSRDEARRIAANIATAAGAAEAGVVNRTWRGQNHDC
jgi:hypothetical protein